jgi:hypothetical protein
LQGGWAEGVVALVRAAPCLSVFAVEAGIVSIFAERPRSDKDKDKGGFCATAEHTKVLIYNNHFFFDFLIFFFDPGDFFFDFF